MESASLTGKVYTDYQKATRIANDPTLLHSMGRKGGLFLLLYLIVLLKQNPIIRLAHVNAKNQESALSNEHLEMDLSIEQ